jgi:hypothetical protein
MARRGGAGGRGVRRAIATHGGLCVSGYGWSCRRYRRCRGCRHERRGQRRNADAMPEHIAPRDGPMSLRTTRGGMPLRARVPKRAPRVRVPVRGGPRIRLVARANALPGALRLVLWRRRAGSLRRRRQQLHTLRMGRGSSTRLPERATHRGVGVPRRLRQHHAGALWVPLRRRLRLDHRDVHEQPSALALGQRLPL